MNSTGELKGLGRGIGMNGRVGVGTGIACISGGCQRAKLEELDFFRGNMSLCNRCINNWSQFLKEEEEEEEKGEKLKDSLIREAQRVGVLSIGLLDEDKKGVLEEILSIIENNKTAFKCLSELRIEGFAYLTGWSIASLIRHINFIGSTNGIDICNFENLKSIKFEKVESAGEIKLENLPRLQKLIFEKLECPFSLDCRKFSSLVHMEANGKQFFVKTDGSGDNIVNFLDK